MRLLAAASLLLLTGCATSAAALYETRVERTIVSNKTTKDFATCVAEHLDGAPEIRSDGDHYWVIRIVAEMPRHRWDFTPTPTGSKAELRSTGIIGAGTDRVEACA